MLGGNILALLTALIWSVSFVCIRVIMRDLDFLTMFIYRFGLASLAGILLWAGWQARSGEWQRPGRGTVWWVILLGVIGGPLYHLPLNWGAMEVSAGLLGMLIATVPVQTAALELILRQRRATLGYLGGIALASGGAALLVYSRNQGHDENWSAANLWHPLSVLGAAFAGALFSVGSRAALKVVDSFTLSIWTLPIGVLCGAALVPLHPLPPHEPLTWQGWGSLLYLALASTLISSVMWIRAIKLIGPGQVCLYLYITMLFSAVWGMWLLDEKLPLLIWPAAACIMGGLHLVNRERLKTVNS